ncbi:MAG: nuclear transport factor 2 family protein [Lacibacter sp.]
MIYKSIFTVLVFMLISTIHAQSTSQIQEKIQQSVVNLFTALTNADTTALKRSCTEDVRFYEYGQIWTIDTLIQKVMQNKSIPDFKRTNSFKFVSTTINKQTAWVTYYLQSTFTRNGKEELVKWMETVVLLKEKTDWKVTVLHSTRLPKN